MLSEAKKKLDIVSYNMPIKLELGDIFSLHFEDEEFDSAIVFRLFHLIPEVSLSLAIKELCRVVNNDILVQSYVPISRFYQFRQKLINRLSFNSSVAKTEEVKTPWSHIQSYCHKQSLLNNEFKKYNLFPSTYKRLDIYGSCEVRATIYSKKN